MYPFPDLLTLLPLIPFTTEKSLVALMINHLQENQELSFQV